MREPTINPYASPAAMVSPEQDARRTALDRLRGPSFGLLLLSGFWGIGGVIWILVVVVLFAASPFHDLAAAVIAEFSRIDLLRLFCTLPSCYVAYGAWCMRTGKRYWVAVTAAALACIPMLSACMWMGIPFGIWALVVLRRSDVRAAFQAYGTVATFPNCRK
jgi:hypothetical protein